MIVSIHHYELAESADGSDFRDAVGKAVSQNLFEGVPGLISYRIGRGIKGTRSGQFAAIWIYESQEVWEDVWGPIDDPVSKREYPDEWLVWEDELLDPVLADDPDEIEFTTYEIIAHGTDG